MPLHLTNINTPEVKAMNLEVDLYALEHKGWNEATHQVSFYYKDADEYAMAGNYYNTSKAGLMFRNAMNKAWSGIYYDVNDKTYCSKCFRRCWF